MKPTIFGCLIMASTVFHPATSSALPRTCQGTFKLSVKADEKVDFEGMKSFFAGERNQGQLSGSIKTKIRAIDLNKLTGEQVQKDITPLVENTDVGFSLVSNDGVYPYSYAIRFNAFMTYGFLLKGIEITDWHPVNGVIDISKVQARAAAIEFQRVQSGNPHLNADTTPGYAIKEQIFATSKDGKTLTIEVSYTGYFARLVFQKDRNGRLAVLDFDERVLTDENDRMSYTRQHVGSIRFNE